MPDLPVGTGSDPHGVTAVLAGSRYARTSLSRNG
jgi:hypothetical protein